MQHSPPASECWHQLHSMKWLSSKMQAPAEHLSLQPTDCITCAQHLAHRRLQCWACIAGRADRRDDRKRSESFSREPAARARGHSKEPIRDTKAPGEMHREPDRERDRDSHRDRDRGRNREPAHKDREPANERADSRALKDRRDHHEPK